MLTPHHTIPTTCPYCGVGCQIDLQISNGLIYRVNGRYDNQVNFGNLCVKGRFGFDYVYAPDRLKQPLQRLNHDKTIPAFGPISWDKALMELSGRLATIRAQHGPDSIAFLVSAKCTNEENYLMQKLARAVIGTNNVDHCARL